jgi:hypothetical protein
MNNPIVLEKFIGKKKENAAIGQAKRLQIQAFCYRQIQITGSRKFSLTIFIIFNQPITLICSLVQQGIKNRVNRALKILLRFFIAIL